MLVSKLLANAISEIAICLIRFNYLMRVTGYVDRIDQIIDPCLPLIGGSLYRKTLITGGGRGSPIKTESRSVATPLPPPMPATFSDILRAPLLLIAPVNQFLVEQLKLSPVEQLNGHVRRARS